MCNYSVVCYLMRLSELLIDRRAKLGLTRRAVALQADATEVTVWRWETAAVLPKPRYYEGICIAYQLTRDELLAAIAETPHKRGVA